jgi:hypothetical protein
LELLTVSRNFNGISCGAELVMSLYHFVGWSKICTQFFFKLSWGNYYGVTPQRERERLCGHQWWKLNIIACGYGGSNAVFGSYGVGVWENVRRG